MQRPPFLIVPFLCVQGLFAQGGAAHIASGDSLLALGQAKKALAAYEQAVQSAPSAETYSARAKAWMALDKLDNYLNDVTLALTIDSSHAMANYQRAVYALRGEDRFAAERVATRGLDGGVQGALRNDLLLVRGQARSELRRHALAVTDLKEGLGERTDQPAAMRALALSLDATGDHEGSLWVMEKLCAVEPKVIGNWTSMGYELAALGRHEEALTAYDKAFALDKDEPVARSNRAWSLLQLGRVDEALKDVERSLRADSGNAYAYRTRGMIRLRQGEREKACNDLARARLLGGAPEVDRMLKDHCEGGR